MIYLIHRGWGGKYTNYVAQTVKNINLMRRLEFTQYAPMSGGKKVAIHHSGKPLDSTMLLNYLSQPKVSFYLGDSKGLPSNVLSEADEIVSLSPLNISHQLEAAILTSAIESLLIQQN